MKLVGAHGVADVGEQARAWGDTAGYPFYVQLWLEEADSGGRTAVTLRRYYERTTRWMSEQQKGWLERTVFLDEVNKCTLRGLLADEHEVEVAYSWYAKEGSVRDTIAPVFCVRPYVRSRLRDYLFLRDPDHCDDLVRRCASMAPASVA